MGFLVAGRGVLWAGEVEKVESSAAAAGVGR